MISHYLAGFEKVYVFLCVWNYQTQVIESLSRRPNYHLIHPFLFEFRPLLLNGGSVIATDEVSVEEETSMLLSIGSISEQQPQVKREICVALIKMLLLELEKPSNLKYHEP